MKRIILISGKLQSGKNQLADFLKDAFAKKNLDVGSDLFAGPLKDWCKEDFKPLTDLLRNIANDIKSVAKLSFDIPAKNTGMSNESSLFNICKTVDDKLLINDENWYEVKTDITRKILQLYGTEIFRKRVDNDWWAKLLLERCKVSEKEVILITDVRFPNELEVFNSLLSDELEVVSIRVERNINTQEIIANHDSETALDNWLEWNYVVDNNGTLDALKASAEKIVEDILDTEKEEINFFTKQPL
jgi:hypothetical protein